MRLYSVTIKELAAELGVSITTVSRALNGYPDVGEKTRSRIVEMAARMGYRPNRNAQRLVTQRTHVLAWIQSDNEEKFVDPHFIEVMAGGLRAARMANYDIMLTSATPDDQRAVYERYVRDNSVDGFIIDLPEPGDKRISFLLECGKPFVVHGREPSLSGYSWVDVDNYGIFNTLARMLIANGHRRMAFINGDEHYFFANARRQGVDDALSELGLPKDSVRVLSTDHPMGNTGFQLTERAIEDKSVTAILYSSALMAVEGHAALVRAGHDPGRTIAIATMDDQLNYLDLSPYAGRFTFARSSLRDSGTVLVREAIRMCEANSKPRGTLIPHSFDLAEGMDGSILEQN